jgi:sec-independent protein translocase protein TatB
MFDIGPSELLLIVIVAVIVIGPKELPAALRAVGRWIGQMRRVSAHFRTGLDAMIREAEMDDLEKKWAAQNAKIMREHPADAPPEAEPTGAYPSPPPPPEPPAAAAEAKVVTSDDPDEYREMPVSDDKPQA